MSIVIEGVGRAIRLYEDVGALSGEAHALAISDVGRKSQTRVRKKFRSWLGVPGKKINRHVKFFGVSKARARRAALAGRSPPIARLWTGIGGIVLHPRTSEYARGQRAAEWPGSFEADVKGGRLWFGRRPNPYRRSPRSRHGGPKGSSLPIDRVGIRIPTDQGGRIMIAVVKAKMRTIYRREYARQFRRLQAQRAQRIGNRAIRRATT